MKPKKVLLPTDLSKGSLAALERGFDLCRQFQAEPHFVHVVRSAEFRPLVPPHEMSTTLGDIYVEVTKRAEVRLQETVEGLASDSSLKPVVRILEGGSVAGALIDYANETGIDLMVVGTHGREGAKRFLLGSQAEKLVRLSPCPVVTLGPEVSAIPARPLRILGALDLAETTDSVVTAVKEWTELYAAEAHFVHVVARIDIPAYADTTLLSPIDHKRLQADAQRRLDEVIERAGLEQLATSQALYGDIDAEVVRHAEYHDIDMIVIGTHGRKGVPHVLLGSVADRIVRRAKCPVLTIRTSQDEAGSRMSAA